MDIYWGAIATVLAALIAALAAWFASVLAKETRISEFRQAWIDALRDDVAEFVGLSLSLGSAVESSNHASKRAFTDALPLLLEKAATDQEAAFAMLEDLTRDAVENKLDPFRADMLRVNQLRMRIRMRLNPKNHSPLLLALAEVDATKFDGLEASCQMLTNTAQTTFSDEWRSVKRGEDVYVSTVRWAKRGAGLAAVMVLVLILVEIYDTFVHRLDAPAGSDRSSSAPAPTRPSPRVLA